MKTQIIFGLLTLTILAGCERITDERHCETVEDCACGVHIKTGECFLGNKAYVNTLKQCPDFCTGIAGDLRSACINNKCTIVKEDRLPDNKPSGFCGTSTFGKCETSDDCIEGGCSGQVCQSKSEEPIITTCEYADCYNPDPYNLKCQCINNMCQWR